MSDYLLNAYTEKKKDEVGTNPYLSFGRALSGNLIPMDQRDPYASAITNIMLNALGGLAGGYGKADVDATMGDFNQRLATALSGPSPVDSALSDPMLKPYASNITAYDQAIREQKAKEIRDFYTDIEKMKAKAKIAQALTRSDRDYLNEDLEGLTQELGFNRTTPKPMATQLEDMKLNANNELDQAILEKAGRPDSVYRKGANAAIKARQAGFKDTAAINLAEFAQGSKAITEKKLAEQFATEFADLSKQTQSLDEVANLTLSAAKDLDPEFFSPLGYGDLKKTAARINSIFGDSEEAKKVLSSSSVFAMIKPTVLKASIPPGERQLNEFETKMYSQAGPSDVALSIEQILTQAVLFKERAKRNREYMDFANNMQDRGYSIAQIKNQWGKYTAENPLVYGWDKENNTGKVYTNYPTWQEYFLGESKTPKTSRASGSWGESNATETGSPTTTPRTKEEWKQQLLRQGVFIKRQ